MTCLRALALLTALALFGSACGPNPNPRLTVASSILAQLAEARTTLMAAPRDPEGTCNTAGDARATLFREKASGVPEQAWSALSRATENLLIACGQLRALQLPYQPGLTVEQAREGWRQGASAALAAMCPSLLEAAGALDTAAAGCK